MNALDIKWTHLTEVLNSFGDRFVELARENIERNGSNASHNLSDSIEKIVEVGEDYYSVKISLDDYWVYLENGRGPGKFPPPPAIRSWIEVKPVTPYPDSQGRIPTVDQLTFLISRKISREGTSAQPFFEPAKEQAIREFSQAIDDAIAADIDAYIEEAVLRMLEKTLGKK